MDSNISKVIKEIRAKLSNDHNLFITDSLDGCDERQFGVFDDDYWAAIQDIVSIALPYMKENHEHALA